MSRMSGGGSGRPPGRPDLVEQVSSEGGVLLELSKAQVDQVVRAADSGGTMSVLLSGFRESNGDRSHEAHARVHPTQMDDPRLSRSLLSGLLVLSSFPADGSYRGIVQVARALEMNTSTTHRYCATLLAVGLLERDPATRRYRLAG